MGSLFGGFLFTETHSGVGFGPRGKKICLSFVCFRHASVPALFRSVSNDALALLGSVWVRNHN